MSIEAGQPPSGWRPSVCGWSACVADSSRGLRGKVKNSLDEARMLMLGAQVLLGFQYRAFFEKGYEKFGPAERALEIAALFALLLTLLLLFLPPARHCIVEHGATPRDSTGFRHDGDGGRPAAFALGLSFELAVAGNRIPERQEARRLARSLSPRARALVRALRPQGSSAGREPEDAVEETPLEHKIVEVLTEARIRTTVASATNRG